MSETFLSYLQRERRRLDQQLKRISSSGADNLDVARLEQLRRIVDDQLVRWSRDLSDPVVA